MEIHEIDIAVSREIRKWVNHGDPYVASNVLAGILNIKVEAVSRSLGRLREQGLVGEGVPGRVTVLLLEVRSSQG